MHSLPIVNIPHQSGSLLQLMNLHGHIIITQSPQFIFQLTLDGVHSMGLDKFIVMCIHHKSGLPRWLSGKESA